jgi:hypothetical protein
VGFRYEWKAWLLAYECFGIGPEEFGKLDYEKQVTAIHYGAAFWDRIKRGKRVYFTFEDIVYALNKASKEDNMKLAQTMAKARWPEWMKNVVEGEDKKKVGP